MADKPMKPWDRLEFSPITQRPPVKLPDGARMAVWTIVNVEDWDIDNPMPRQILSPPQGQPLQPDIPNWSWHEYGMRVGFWRILELLQTRAITPTLATNGRVIETYRPVAEAARDAGWEFMGHGYIQLPMHKLDDQVAAIRDTISAIKAFTGKPPRGWESPGLTETFDTLDHLAAEGIEYVADWVFDDQPVELKTKSGRLHALPYTVETNDVPMMTLQHHASDEFMKRAIAQFDRLYLESAEITRVMAISVHPYLSGAPHRIGYLEQLYDHILSRPDVKLWTGEQILDWFVAAANP
jgi:peptidoglycan/xylan/chitin deacetylase (PgdA/CDA1 family)